MNPKQTKDYIKRLKKVIKRQREELRELRSPFQKKTGGTTGAAQKK